MNIRVKGLILCLLLESCKFKNFESSSTSTITQATPDDPTLGLTTIEALLKSLKADPSGIFKSPTWQDLRAKEVGISLSEEIDLPFVLSPRRQTDYTVRQLYTLLPKEIKSNVAFLITERFAKDPEKYLKYLNTRQKVVIIGSFAGVKEASKYQGSLEQKRHAQELAALRYTVAWIRLTKKALSGVFFAMGDSPGSGGRVIRLALEGHLKSSIATVSPAYKHFTMGYGADELAAEAFAAQLPKAKIFAQFSDPYAVGYYDSGINAGDIYRDKCEEVGLIPLAPAEKPKADILLHAVTLSRNTKVASVMKSGISPQEDQEANQKFSSSLAELSEGDARKSVVMDIRVPNGVLDSKVLPPRCDFLAFGGWGTMGNTMGHALATAKILHFSKDDQARKQLLMEAISHDVFANGYTEAQTPGSPFHQRLKSKGISFDHSSGYQRNWTVVKTVFQSLNEHLQTRVSEFFKNTPCLESRKIIASPQFWRTFESEIHMFPAVHPELSISGASHQNPDNGDVFLPEMKSLKKLGIDAL